MNTVSFTGTTKLRMGRKLTLICLTLLVVPIAAYANPVVLLNPFPLFLLFATFSIPAILVEVGCVHINWPT